MVFFFLQQNFLHRSILFSLIVNGKPTVAVPDTRWFQQVTDARHPSRPSGTHRPCEQRVCIKMGEESGYMKDSAGKFCTDKWTRPERRSEEGLGTVKARMEPEKDRGCPGSHARSREPM